METKLGQNRPWTAREARESETDRGNKAQTSTREGHGPSSKTKSSRGGERGKKLTATAGKAAEDKETKLPAHKVLIKGGGKLVMDDFEIRREIAERGEQVELPRNDRGHETPVEGTQDESV